jgi:hypothetical protein
MTRQLVTLVDGPFDGDTRMVEPNFSEMTLSYVTGYALSDYGGEEPVRTEQTELASYRRTGPDVFTFCRTQAGLGDLDREFYTPEGKENDMSEAPQPEPQPQPTPEPDEPDEPDEPAEPVGPASEPVSEIEF